MHRFYVDRIDGEQVSISDSEQLHHLRDVLRLKVNDEVMVFDSRGNEYAGLITALDRKQAILKVTPVYSSNKYQPRLTVACAIPQGNRMDELVDHLTQLGAESIIPMSTERVVVRLDDDRKENRLERWRKIARNAARQSQRSNIPLIQPVTRIEGVILQSQDFDLKLILTLAGERKFIKEVLAGAKPNHILVLIGPEGDFTPKEIEMALREGFIAVSLGDTVLRVATAAMAAASYIKLALNS